jgi:putative SOS response-associated peptidase YedK
MCGRIAREYREDYERFGIEELSETDISYRWLGRYNIAPTQDDVIIRPAAERRELVASRWGLIPSWSKDASIASKTFNARAESLLERPSFRGLVSRHRCIVPISGYYEWRAEGKKRFPLYIHRADGEPIALAGLWTTWTDPASGSAVTSHTVITTAANDRMRPIHARMPVLLEDDALDAWLDPTVTERELAWSLLAAPPDDRLVAHPVSTLVNSVRNDGPELIAPID